MATAATFILSVIQGGLDVTAKVAAGGVEIHAKVRAARRCTYQYTVADEGELNPAQLVGATVSVTLDTGGGPGTIFTGTIARSPVYDAARRVFAVVATDGWQEFFDGKTEAELLALIPGGTYREDLDGKRASGRQQAQAILSSVAQDAFLDAGGSFQLVDWTPKATGMEDGTVDGTAVRDIVTYLADADQLVNAVTINYRHSFVRRVWNRIGFSWQYGVGPDIQTWSNWCDWYQMSGHELPIREEIIQAARGTGWKPIGSILFTGHPETFGPGTNRLLCGSNIGWILSDYFRTEVIRASWKGGKTYSVEAAEELQIAMTASSSVTEYGNRGGELRFDADTPHPADAVDADDDPYEPAGFTPYGGGGNQSYKDEIDLPRRQENVETALEKGRVLIWESHRRNGVTWTMLANVGLELGQTWTVTHPLVTARGTVTEFVHRINLTSARTTMTIACFIGGGGTDDARTAPPMTVQEPAEAAPGTVFIANKIGGRPDSDDYDEAWKTQSNWIGNHPVTTQNPNKIYNPLGFYVLGPDIPENAREPLQLTANPAYALQIPETTIQIYGGS